MPVVTSQTQPRRTRLVRQGLLLVVVGLSLITAYQFFYKSQPRYTIEVIKTPGGWGYDILKNDKLVIHQPTIPGQSGMADFASQAQAHRVGERVVQKLKQKQELPTLTNEELRQLGVTIP